jgi:Rps23 Pro-64 3,4-dihydroxylase Tpa1-like proline 4-hydroxylase
MLGAWTTDILRLAMEYKRGTPYDHLVIENFLDEEFAEIITKEFPETDSSWHVYDTPFEQKYLKSNINDATPNIKKLVDYLNSDKFAGVVSSITGITDLEPDPTLNAGGLHCYKRNGFIDIHLDYTIHPVTKKERRVSFMLYMSKNWKDEYGGNLQLWNENLTVKKELKTSLWNVGLFFKTSENTYHGLPDKITCPENMSRNVIGLYYLSPPREETLANPRYNAQMFPKPGRVINEKLEKLYAIRKNRRLIPDDFSDWPNWKEECGII